MHFQGKCWQADNLPILPQPLQQPHPPPLLAANSNDTFPYAARLRLGAVCTTLRQPVPRLIDRLAEYAAARPTHGTTLPQRVYVMVSFFVAKTRAEAHAVARENWRDTDMANGIAFMQSLGSRCFPARFYDECCGLDDLGLCEGQRDLYLRRTCSVRGAPAGPPRAASLDVSVHPGVQ